MFLQWYTTHPHSISRAVHLRAHAARRAVIGGASKTAHRTPRLRRMVVSCGAELRCTLRRCASAMPTSRRRILAWHPTHSNTNHNSRQGRRNHRIMRMDCAHGISLRGIDRHRHHTTGRVTVASERVKVWGAERKGLCIVVRVVGHACIPIPRGWDRVSRAAYREGGAVFAWLQCTQTALLPRKPANRTATESLGLGALPTST